MFKPLSRCTWSYAYVEIIKIGFFKEVKKETSDVGIIDSTSEHLKKNSSVTDNETKSLLSKIAFLVNPSVFTLYDTLAKASLWKIMRGSNELKRKDLESYAVFHEHILKLVVQLKKQKKLDHAKNILRDFKGTVAHNYFTKNPEAYELRVVDKLLWIKGQKKDARKINNEQYSKLLKLA